MLPKKDIPDMSGQLLEIGARIARFRRQKNLSQEELAEQVFITPTQLSRIERGQVNCKLMTLLSLGRSLEVSTDELLGIDSPGNESLAELQSILEHFTKKSAEFYMTFCSPLRRAFAATKLLNKNQVPYTAVSVTCTAVYGTFLEFCYAVYG